MQTIRHWRTLHQPPIEPLEHRVVAPLFGRALGVRTRRPLPIAALAQELSLIAPTLARGLEG